MTARFEFGKNYLEIANLQFDFEAHQTSLPPFIKSLKKLIEEYNEI